MVGQRKDSRRFKKNKTLKKEEEKKTQTTLANPNQANSISGCNVSPVVHLLLCGCIRFHFASYVVV